MSKVIEQEDLKSFNMVQYTLELPTFLLSLIEILEWFKYMCDFTQIPHYCSNSHGKKYSTYKKKWKFQMHQLSSILTFRLFYSYKKLLQAKCHIKHFSICRLIQENTKISTSYVLLIFFFRTHTFNYPPLNYPIDVSTRG